MTANPGKMITIHDLASLTNAAYQASFTAKNITAVFAKPGILPLSRLALTRILSHHLLRLWKIERRNLEIPVPSATTPVAREISRTSKDGPSLEDVRPFPNPGPRYDRRQRKKVKSRILTDSSIKDRIEQEALARAALKKKYCKGAKNYINKIPYILESDPHLTLIRTSFCRFFKRKKVSLPF